jgi:hypothetical protein
VGQCTFCKADAELPEFAKLPIGAKASAEHKARRTCAVSAQEIRFALIQRGKKREPREHNAQIELLCPLRFIVYQYACTYRKIGLRRQASKVILGTGGFSKSSRHGR